MEKAENPVKITAHRFHKVVTEVRFEYKDSHIASWIINGDESIETTMESLRLVLGSLKEIASEKNGGPK